MQHTRGRKRGAPSCIASRAVPGGEPQAELYQCNWGACLSMLHQDADPKSMLEVPYSECRQALTAVHAPQAYKGSMTPTAPERAMRTPKPAVSLEAPTSVPEGSAEQAEVLRRW